MAIMNAIPPGATPGERVAALAQTLGNARAAFMNGTLGGTDLMLYQKLSSLQCWDASLLCAWAAKGIDSAAIDMNASNFNLCTIADCSRIFGANALNNAAIRVADAAAMRGLPPGCFIGFLRTNGAHLFRHCMLHIGNGIGAGNKSDCVLSAGNTVGWEILDMTAAFGTDLALNANTRIVYTACTGQTI